MKETLTKQAHTPGPWRTEPHSNPKMGFTVYAPDVSVYATEGELCVIADYLTEGNARLIAAAPEMLEALEQICNRVEGGGYRPTQEDFTRCEAAIRKAKGEL